MSCDVPKNEVGNSNSKSDSADTNLADDTPTKTGDRPKEVGGRGGLDPTRYGDWEKAGRCIDF